MPNGNKSIEFNPENKIKATVWLQCIISCMKLTLLMYIPIKKVNKSFVFPCVV